MSCGLRCRHIWVGLVHLPAIISAILAGRLDNGGIFGKVFPSFVATKARDKPAVLYRRNSFLRSLNLQ